MCYKNKLRLPVHSAPQVTLQSCWSKLVNLYSSPQVKFYWNIVSYFAFLFLFATVLLVDFQSSPSGCELLLYIWLLSLVCEEFRQVRCCSCNTQVLQSVMMK